MILRGCSRTFQRHENAQFSHFSTVGKWWWQHAVWCSVNRRCSLATFPCTVVTKTCGLLYQVLDFKWAFHVLVSECSCREDWQWGRRMRNDESREWGMVGTASCGRAVRNIYISIVQVPEWKKGVSLQHILIPAWLRRTFRPGSLGSRGKETTV